MCRQENLNGLYRWVRGIGITWCGSGGMKNCCLPQVQTGEFRGPSNIGRNDTGALSGCLIWRLRMTVLTGNPLLDLLAWDISAHYIYIRSRHELPFQFPCCHGISPVGAIKKVHMILVIVGHHTRDQRRRCRMDTKGYLPPVAILFEYRS